MYRTGEYRRHKMEVWKKRVRSYYGGWPAENPRANGMVARTRCLCSCVVCNPYKVFGTPTRQEVRSKDEAKEEMMNG